MTGILNMLAAFKTRRELTSYTTHSSFLKRIQNKKDEAWLEFYKRYAGMIYRIGRKRGLTDEECDDLLTDVMVIFWKKMDSFIYDRDRGLFRNYLARIAHFAAIKLFAGRKSEKLCFSDGTEYPPEIDQIYMDEWRDFILNKALEDLQMIVDTETYQVFYMLFVQQRPVAEISSVTRKTANNIYVIRSRCLRKLRMIIENYRKAGEEGDFFNSSKNADAAKLS